MKLVRAAQKALELQRKAGGFNRAQALAAAAFVEVSVIWWHDTLPPFFWGGRVDVTGGYRAMDLCGKWKMEKQKSDFERTLGWKKKLTS